MLETARPAVFNSKPQLLAMIPLPTPEMTPAGMSHRGRKNGVSNRTDLRKPKRTSSCRLKGKQGEWESKIALLVETREGGKRKKKSARCGQRKKIMYITWAVCLVYLISLHAFDFAAFVFYFILFYFYFRNIMFRYFVPTERVYGTFSGDSLW